MSAYQFSDYHSVAEFTQTLHILSQIAQNDLGRNSRYPPFSLVGQLRAQVAKAKLNSDPMVSPAATLLLFSPSRSKNNLHQSTAHRIPDKIHFYCLVSLHPSPQCNTYLPAHVTSSDTSSVLLPYVLATLSGHLIESGCSGSTIHFLATDSYLISLLSQCTTIPTENRAFRLWAFEGIGSDLTVKSSWIDEETGETFVVDTVSVDDIPTVSTTHHIRNSDRLIVLH